MVRDRGLLPVYVVDDHHHAIRRRLLPFSNVTIVHLDAHPDLAFPRSIPAATIFAPEALYDALDASDAGIASFLLPLAYAGHLRHLVWVKPPWATQMATGDHEFLVGTDACAVSSHEAYFVDEDLFARAETLSEAKPLSLTVAELPAAPTPTASSFVLDICLDYFSTHNPFLQDLVAAKGPTTAALVRSVYCGLLYKCVPAAVPHEVALAHRRLFASTMTTIFRDELWTDKAAFAAHVAPLSDLYQNKPPRAVQQELEAFRELLAASSPDDLDLIQWAGPCIDLPEHETSEAEIDAMLQAFDAYLAAGDRPRVVTIAESKGDAYTPAGQVAGILSRVLAILEARFGSIAVTKHDTDELLTDI
ncbi:UPF0489 protein C5orf22-like [Achlya hypogyna]|uniref:UPF0489 protein C5orf22-like n=1 Tax=Achlya hypogyna TaxID=1202772 RepID=A0A1V9Z4E5_ACHHY|nr:UPF0489 protein C5orf22-like [Achlya hypogyna]